MALATPTAAATNAATAATTAAATVTASATAAFPYLELLPYPPLLLPYTAISATSTAATFAYLELPQLLLLLP